MKLIKKLYSKSKPKKAEPINSHASRKVRERQDGSLRDSYGSSRQVFPDSSYSSYSSDSGSSCDSGGDGGGGGCD